AVPVMELLFGDEQNTVDKCSIAAAEIAQECGLTGHTEKTVLATDPVARRSDMALGPTADVIIADRKEQLLSGRPSLDYRQLKDHECDAPPCSTSDFEDTLSFLPDEREFRLPDCTILTSIVACFIASCKRIDQLFSLLRQT